MDIPIAELCETRGYLSVSAAGVMSDKTRLPGKYLIQFKQNVLLITPVIDRSRSKVSAHETHFLPLCIAGSRACCVQICAITTPQSKEREAVQYCMRFQHWVGIS